MIIENALIINEGERFAGSILINDNGVIEKIQNNVFNESIKREHTIIDGNNKILIPGIIDDQVHFREPGLTHKGNIYSESKAAVAGGITSFMEMPNTRPQTITQKALEEKYLIASKTSLANYSFYIGATNDNLDELMKTNPLNVCGIKIFMGSSTGNMLVDSKDSLEKIFSHCKIPIAVHCEDEETIQKNTKIYKAKFGENMPIKYHSTLRSEEACFKSSSFAVSLAKKHNTRLHILHLSTAKELSLFDYTLPSINKKITGEVCVHHLWFDESDYDKLGTKIKWNPSIKTYKDKTSLLAGLLENKIDVIATDHAPHTIEEKNNSYFKAPSGGPLVQHSLIAMLELYHKGKISLEKIVEKMAHSPADIFQIEKRGYIREGYWADLVLIDLNNPWIVKKENILYKCGWSPFEDITFNSKVTHTIINGHLVFENGYINEKYKGKRLLFNRS